MTAIPVFIFFFGAMVGSFANVCIFRMPQRLSVVRPRSFCPACKKMVRAYDNIPLVSWWLLGRKCRDCRAPIRSRYFWVELSMALGFLGLYYHYGLSLLWVVAAALYAALVIVTFIDMEHQIIPDEISIPGIGVGLLVSFLIPSLHGAAGRGEALLASALGVLAGGGSIYCVGVFGTWVFKKESMGGGDVKLLAMIGAFLGWQLTLFTFFFAPFFGVVVGVYQRLRHGEERIPYGPFLALAAMITLLWGDRIMWELFGFS